MMCRGSCLSQLAVFEFFLKRRGIARDQSVIVTNRCDLNTRRREKGTVSNELKFNGVGE